jgi:hypothetical protein
MMDQAALEGDRNAMPLNSLNCRGLQDFWAASGRREALGQGREISDWSNDAMRTDPRKTALMEEKSEKPPPTLRNTPPLFGNIGCPSPSPRSRKAIRAKKLLDLVSQMLVDEEEQDYPSYNADVVELRQHVARQGLEMAEMRKQIEELRGGGLSHRVERQEQEMAAMRKQMKELRSFQCTCHPNQASEKEGTNKDLGTKDLEARLLTKLEKKFSANRQACTKRDAKVLETQLTTKFEKRLPGLVADAVKGVDCGAGWGRRKGGDLQEQHLNELQLDIQRVTASLKSVKGSVEQLQRSSGKQSESGARPQEQHREPLQQQQQLLAQDSGLQRVREQQALHEQQLKRVRERLQEGEESGAIVSQQSLNHQQQLEALGAGVEKLRTMVAKMLRADQGMKDRRMQESIGIITDQVVAVTRHYIDHRLQVAFDHNGATNPSKPPKPAAAEAEAKASLEAALRQ